MNPASNIPSVRVPRWAPVLGLVTFLYLIYSPSFLTDYLMNDEWGNVGRHSESILAAVVRTYYSFGRGLFGAYFTLVYNFAGADTARIQFIRFLNFACLALVAVALLEFLQRDRMKNRWLAFLTVLFFFSQLPFQAAMGFSLQLISNTVPSIWLSLLAFYLYFYVFPRGHLPRLLQAVVVFVILTLAMQSTQNYAFFCTIPLAYLALSDWTNRKRQIVEFLLIAFGVMASSILVYKLGLDALHQAGRQGYVMGEQGVSELLQSPVQVILNTINPLAYGSAFKLWTFPYPLTNLKPLTPSVRQALIIVVMLAWSALIAVSIWAELRGASKEAKQAIALKWLAVLACFSLAAVFIIADWPTKVIDHRPHIYLTFSGLLCFSGGYALDILIQDHGPWRKSLVAPVIGTVVILTALGAQAGFLRNVINNHVRQMDFVRSALLSKEPSTYNAVIVVLPDDPHGSPCVSEPCGEWIGDVIPDRGVLQLRGFYRYALINIGANPSKETITFVQRVPAAPPATAVVVDWNVFLRSILATGHH